MENEEITFHIKKQANSALNISIKTYPITQPPSHLTMWRDTGIFSLGVGITVAVFYILRERSLMETVKTIATNKMPLQGKWFPSFF
jgi:hypothetical protein